MHIMCNYQIIFNICKCFFLYKTSQTSKRYHWMSKIKDEILQGFHSGAGKPNEFTKYEKIKYLFNVTKSSYIYFLFNIFFSQKL